MDKILVVGTGRNAATRLTRRQRPGRKTRQVRIGGVYVVRPGRSITLTMAQLANYAKEIADYESDGLVVLQDGSGRVYQLSELMADAEAPATKEASPPPPPDPAPPAPTPSASDPEPEVEVEEEEDIDYDSMSYADLKDMVTARGLSPESMKKADLITALKEADDEE